MVTTDPAFRLLAEAVPQLVFAATTVGTCDYVNRRIAELTGLPGDGPIALAGAVHADDLAAALAAWQAGARAGQPWTLRCRWRRRDGGHVRCHFAVEPQRDDGGRVVGWLATGDVDDAPFADPRLRQERLEAALRGSGTGTFR
ncbi:MAG TPA: PAS domain-containing protein, partial [Polyangia bacterium]